MNGSGFQGQTVAGAEAGRGRARNDRRGYSLIEALVVISINSILLAVALTLLGTLLKSERHGRRHYEQTQSVVRLANDLRRAVAAADGAEDDPRGAVLRLHLPGGRAVEFARDEDRVRRVERQGSSVVRRESYHLDGLTAAKFVVSPDKLIRLELNVRGEDPWRIDARLASDLRYARAAPSSAGS